MAQISGKKIKKNALAFIAKSTIIASVLGIRPKSTMIDSQVIFIITTILA